MTAARQRAKKPGTSLRAALAAKQVYTTHYDIPLVTRAQIEPLAERLQQARNNVFRLRVLVADPDAKDVEKADREQEAAQAALDACFHRLEFRGLPGDDDLDALMNAHPVTDKQIADAKAQIARAKERGDKEIDESMPPYDLDAFNVALLVACVIEGDGLTEDDWREELWSDRWTPADRADLFRRVLEANRKPFSEGISKD